METVTDYLFLGSKITVDGDCSHETKRCLLLERKAMINLDHILRSRDVALPTKVCIVKAVVFLVVICGFESWTIKKADWCFWTVVLKKTLENPLDYKEIKPVNPKGNQSWIFIGMTDAETPILWQPDAKCWPTGKTLMLGKVEGRKRRGWQKMSLLDGIVDSIHMSLNKLWDMVKDRGTSNAAVRGVVKSWTWLSYWTITLICRSVSYRSL